MPSYDSYAYEALGRLFVDYQQGGDTTYWEHRRVPIQLITRADSEQHALKSIPFSRARQDARLESRLLD